MEPDLTPALSIAGVSLSFGGIQVLQDVSFAVGKGEVVGIIGPNGAGKTSLLNCINGSYRPESGDIALFGHSIIGSAPHTMAAKGLGRTFQGFSLQRDSSVMENILLGCDFRQPYGLIAAIAHAGRSAKVQAEQARQARSIAEMLDIGHLLDAEVTTLPWGLQKRVEIARALAAQPSLLLLDEPTAGMTRREKDQVADCLRRIKQSLGITQILIEHDVRFVAELCERVVALDFGKVIAAGPAAEVLTHPEVVSAYIGT